VIRVLALVSGISCVCACGNAMKEWSDLDTTGAQDQKNAAIQLESICSRDGGPCPAAAVRSVENAQCINASSMLYRHGQGPADAGCTP
jgi:hypothetical protein